MLHVIVGVIAIVLGLRGLIANWYLFKDMLAAVLPFALLCFGMVALPAGIRRLKRN